MRIAEIRVYHVQIPLKSRIRHASHTRSMTDSLVTRCTLDDGTIGWGEGLPRRYVTGETIEVAFDLLRETPLAEQLGGAIETLPDALSVCDRLVLNRPQPDDRNCYGNSIRCAIELSILDAACRAFETPLSAITRMYPAAAGVRHDRPQVRYSGVITSSSPLKQRLKAWLFRLNRFHQTKVKVGVTDDDDVAALRRIRGIVGRSMDLRIDANEAWSGDTVEARVAELQPFGITSVEQPVRHAEVNSLARIRPRISAPIMLDESLCSLEDAHRAIECGTCDLFNIRLSKCGGFLNSLKLAQTAHQAGLGFQLGCQVGETGILSAAGRHFASSVARIRYLEGSYDRYLVRERLTVEDLTFGRGGYAPALTTPGLGITVDERRLQRVTFAAEGYTITPGALPSRTTSIPVVAPAADL